ncbi:MAG: hypothetical protein P4L56_22625 [Candidatus Sulfopaludibacter sp.]|nr:hypothetical protein [Candidatus Sulfopaludibacter sp.]
MIRAPRCILFFCAANIVWAQQFLINTVAGGTAPSSASSALQVSIGDPPRVAVDAAGNVYFGSLHSVFKVDRLGALSRIAGTGRSGYTGDGGPALAAQLNYPDGIVVDAAGNIYVVDRAAHVIRKISGGNISTIAGNGTSGYSGDGGPAAAAQLNGPTGITMDPAGNLYVGDTGNNVVRKIARDGTIATFAGNGNQGYGSDGVPATATSLNQPQGVSWDAAGNLYIADTNNQRVRRVAPDGTIATVAGNGLADYSGDNVGGTGIVSSSGDNGPAIKAPVVLPTDVAADQSGNLYIADFGNSKIRTVSSAGVIATLIGNLDGVPPENGQAAASIRLNGPTGVAVDSAGTVYFTEGSVGTGSGLVQSDYMVWKVADGIFTAFAGTGENSYSGDGGPAVTAQIDTPGGVAMDSAGNLYIADSRNHRIRKMTPGGAIATVAGNGTAGFSGDGKSALNAQLNGPSGVAVDPSGTIYIADTNNNRIRVVTPEGIIYTLAGNGNAGYFGDGGMAINGSLHAPQGVAVDNLGNFYIADTLDHRVRRVSQTDNIITTIAGNGNPAFSGDGGLGASAALNLPVAVALDGPGNVYIADQGNGRIRVVSQSGVINTVAGNGNSPSSQLYNPSGVAVDRQGNIDIADTGHNRIQQAFPGGIVTIAGTGACCYAGDGGPASTALLNAPFGMVIDPTGIIYFADSGNNAIRQLTGTASINASIASVANAASNLTGPVAPGEIVTISGVALGPPQLVTEQVANGMVTTSLSGTTVTFNGIAAPVIYTSAGQVSAVVPFGIAGSTAQVAVQYRGQFPAQATVPVAVAAPALFTADYSGSGQALALNQDGSTNGNCPPNLPGTPVHASCFPAGLNTLITLFITGAGQTSPGGIDGQIQGSATASPVLPLGVKIGGVDALVLFVSGVQDEVAGITQIQAQIPGNVQPGPAVPVVVQVGPFSTQQATISISQ